MLQDLSQPFINLLPQGSGENEWVLSSSLSLSSLSLNVCVMYAYISYNKCRSCLSLATSRRSIVFRHLLIIRVQVPPKPVTTPHQSIRVWQCTVLSCYLILDKLMFWTPLPRINTSSDYEGLADHSPLCPAAGSTFAVFRDALRCTDFIKSTLEWIIIGIKDQLGSDCRCR
jgi:hypothetical protein